MAAVNDIVWHNASTGEIQLWLMNEHRVAGRATVLGENGQPALIGPPWSIVGCAGVGGDSYSNIFWHNSSTGALQIWFLDRERCTARATVLGEDGTPAFVGPPWAVVAVADFDGDAQADILWHNSSTGEIQIWFLERERCTARATVLSEDGTPALIGPPWSIVGAGDFDQDGSADILWHNSFTGEIQIWFLEHEHRAARATVLGEDGKPALIGPPWSIVGVSDANGDANADILWHNSSTGEIQIWFLDREHRTARATVLGEDGKPTFIGPPWSIVATTDSALSLKPDDRWFQVHAETKMHVGSKVSALEGFTGHVDLYATGPDGTVWTTFFQDRIWQPWGQVRPETRMHPGATVSCSKPFDGHVDLYATDSEGIVWTTFFQAGETSFRPWAQIHPDTRMAPGAEVSVLTPFEGHVDLYATAADGAVWTTFFQAGAAWWTPWVPIHHETKLAPGAPLSVFSDPRSLGWAWSGQQSTGRCGRPTSTTTELSGDPGARSIPRPGWRPGAAVTFHAAALLATDATGTVWASLRFRQPVAGGQAGNQDGTRSHDQRAQRSRLRR